MRWLLVVALAGCAQPEPGPVVPADLTVLGRTPVGVTPLTIDLGDRGGFVSEIPINLHHPTRRTDPTPVIVWSGSEGVRPDQYNDSANFLVSWGFTVVVPQYDSAASPRDAAGLVDDVEALVGALPDLDLPEDVRIDTNLVGLVGHGRGATQSFSARHPAVDVVVGLATEGPFADPGVPLTLVGMGRAAEEPSCGGVDHDLAVAAAPSGTVHASLPTAGPNDLVDDCVAGRGDLACIRCVPGDDPEATATWVRAALVSALSEQLLDEPDRVGWVTLEAATELLPDAEVSSVP
jgi:hypothetical protein